ncbi:MAG: efflux RND transporter periplasmic adaptor subunit, partial [Cyanobacteriota bacterium]|nr:efflux RND transporter periplasmic adaptor subunit [Cyanobacteriota bacterium]
SIVFPRVIHQGVEGKTMLGIAVFIALTLNIIHTTNKLKSSQMSSMGSHDMGGHDMSGMSHDDMMRVDGAFNPTPVTIEVVRPERLEASVNYTGAIYPYTEITVYPRVAGQLSNYSIYPGDRVEAGQILANLEALERITETKEAEAEVAALLAAVEVSQSELEEQQQIISQIQADLNYLQLRRKRFGYLSKEGAISRDDFDIVASQVEAKKAMLQGAQAKLNRLKTKVASDLALVDRAKAQVATVSTFENYTQITSPITGIVQERMADPGVVVQPGMGIFKIGDYRQVRLRANVGQQDANFVQVGTPIVATVPGTDIGKIPGVITSIFPQTDMTTRTITVEAVVENPGQRLLSGQFIEMEIITRRQANALLIPQKALVEFNGEPAVWVLNGDTAQRQPVTTGLTNGDQIEITKGLRGGDEVITSGQSRLMEDGKVTIVDELGNPVNTPVNDFTTAKTSSIGMALVSPTTVKSGKTELTIVLKDTQTGEPLAIAAKDLDLKLTMPMKNMAPMIAKVKLEPTDAPGEFKINTFFGMKGEWILEAAVTDAEYTGKTSLSLSVQ